MSEGQLPSSFDGNQEFFEEKRWRKIFRRLKEEPLIPLGCALTVWAFSNAARSIRKGDSHTANIMFRRRLYAQSFTIVAMVAGSMYYRPERLKRRESDHQVQEQKAKEKREAWIRELEARDEDEKEWKEKQSRAAARDRKPTPVNLAREKSSPESGVIAGKMAQEQDQGTESEGGDSSVVKAVKKLKAATQESAEAAKERIVSTGESVEAAEESTGSSSDAKEIKREK